MDLKDRIEAFKKLGDYLSAIDEVALKDLMEKARNENPWFTEDNVRLSLHGVKIYLNPDNLRRWTSNYILSPADSKTVAVIMAGNIPLVGFHDLLSVLISGHAILIKPSSKDRALLTFVADALMDIEPRYKLKIKFAEQLKNFDAVIATGSDNSARYFHYYFGKYPNVIRKNRTSCAVLDGKESLTELQSLGNDIFTYYGLGCRNVSKIFIPKKYDLSLLLDSWSSFKNKLDHYKYHNNYDYQKSILLVNQIPFLDSGFVLLQESQRLVSPISVLYFERYEDVGSLALRITGERQKIQCIVGSSKPATVPFGKSQSPMPWDYADQMDTLKFLQNLN